MQPIQRRTIAALLLAVFTFFYCGNVFFTHIHCEDNVRIVHSHPYLPSSHHSHTSAQFAGIVLANNALHAAVAADNSFHIEAPAAYAIFDCPSTADALAAADDNTSRRAPPTFD